MSALVAGRLFGGVRAAARVLPLALLFVTTGALAASSRESWATKTGDDRQWSQPHFDDSTWVRVPMPSTWREQKLQGYDGIVWYRHRVTARDADKDELGLLLGPPAYGGYEVYAGGRSIGRSRGWATPLAFGFPEVFRVPRDVIGTDGTVTLALRVRRIGWASDADPDGAPVGATLTLGSYPALRDRVQNDWTDRLLSELPLLVLSVLFAFVFLHHVREHLWFALLALAFAINTFASTYWIYELTASRGLAARLSDMTGHLAAAFAIQFLWTFFSRPISRPLRAYQLSHVALAAFVAFWPSLRIVFASATARWLWLLPLLVLAAVLVIREMRRGDAEARIVAAGGVLMIVAQTAELARNVFPMPWPFDFSIAAFGFGAVLMAMSLALSFRFRRVHAELDRLRSRLEDDVQERTRDLAEARDEALASYRVKSEFLANISHEIRTPMNGVIGMAELLACSELTPEQQKRVEAIQSSGRSLLTLLNDVLDFSRLESKSLTVQHNPFRVRSVVEDCIEIMRPLASGKGLSLTSTIADDIPQALTGDAQRTRQVLLNLLTNAIKFTARGRIDVAVRSRTLDDGRVEVRFLVSDTGPGIAPEEVGRLFVAFQQLDGSSTRHHGGAGLGLAISKRLTELMGGTISVDTTPGRGSTFEFTIVGEPATIDWPQPAETPASRSPRPLRILLAEDEAINQIVIQDMLQHLGYHADCVSNGTELLQALERNAYDVILLDVQMPGMDGFEVTRRIRSSGTMQPYIIAITAHALAGDRERCLAAGMNDYLSKPLSLPLLQYALAGAARLAS